jgi:hypothetical protein
VNHATEGPIDVTGQEGARLHISDAKPLDRHIRHGKEMVESNAKVLHQLALVVRFEGALRRW